MPVTVVRAARVQDRYGTETLDWDTTTETQTLGYLQSHKDSEDNIGRTQAVTDAVVFLPVDVDVLATDRLLIDGGTWFVNGPPQMVYRIATPHHQVADVSEVTG